MTTKPPGKRTHPRKATWSLGAASEQAQREMAAALIPEQRRWLNELADLIEQGHPLESESDRKVVAGIVRLHAASMKPKQRARGRPPKVYDPGGAAISVAGKIHGGLTREAAVGAVALDLGVDDRTIGKIFDDHQLMLQSLGISTGKNTNE